MMRNTRRFLAPRLIACAFTLLVINATKLLAQSLELGSPVPTLPESSSFRVENIEPSTSVSQVGLRTAAPSSIFGTQSAQGLSAGPAMLDGSFQADFAAPTVGNRWVTFTIVGLIVGCAVGGAVIYFRRAKSWSEQLILLHAGRSLLWPKDLRTLRQLAGATDLNPASLLTSRAVFEHAARGSTESHIQRLRIKIFGR